MKYEIKKISWRFWIIFDSYKVIYYCVIMFTVLREWVFIELSTHWWNALAMYYQIQWQNNQRKVNNSNMLIGCRTYYCK